MLLSRTTRKASVVCPLPLGLNCRNSLARQSTHKSVRLLPTPHSLPPPEDDDGPLLFGTAVVGIKFDDGIDRFEVGLLLEDAPTSKSLKGTLDREKGQSRSSPSSIEQKFPNQPLFPATIKTKLMHRSARKCCNKGKSAIHNVVYIRYLSIQFLL